MKRALYALPVLGLVAAARTESPFVSGHVVEARRAAKIPLDGRTGAWASAEVLPVTLSPQRTLALVDREANRLYAEQTPRQAELRALYNGKQLALSVSWPDAQRDVLQLAETDTYGDALAIEFPVDFGLGIDLPYIGMGDEKHPVAVHFTRDHEGGAVTQHFVAAGFGSLTHAPSEATMSLEYDAAAARWTAVLVRPLADAEIDLRHGLVPVAFAAWDGARLERGGYKSISAWRFVRLGGYRLDSDYVDELSWGLDGEAVGNAPKGAELALANCSACHRMGEGARFAMEELAPDLASVGAYALPVYLRHSIQDPSHVVIRSRNPNHHYDPQAPRSDLGHHPPSELTRWYHLDDKGQPVSKMPALSNLSESDVNDIVAYLLTLAPGAR